MTGSVSDGRKSIEPSFAGMPLSNSQVIKDNTVAKLADKPTWMVQTDTTWRPLRQSIKQVATSKHAAYLSANEYALEEQPDWLALQAAQAAAQQQVQELYARYTATLAELCTFKTQLLARLQHDLVRLALLIAQELVMGDVSAKQAFAAKMVEHGLTLLQQSTALTVRLHPQDKTALFAAHPEWGDLAHVQFVEDSALAIGGAVVTSQDGKVDGSLQTRLQAMSQALLNSTEPVA